jgi:hypothetical protein
MLDAWQLKAILSLKAKLESWADRSYGQGHFAGDDDPRADELEELMKEFPWSSIMDMLRLLRSEYIEQLAAQFGSEPLVQKLALVDYIAATARSR